MPEIIEYRPEWACDFARYAKMPRTALGPLALRIDHNRIFMFALTGVRTSDIPCCFAIFSAPRPPWPRLMPKRSLAANLGDPSTYPDVKDPIVDLIYLAARDWAERTGWNPP